MQKVGLGREARLNRARRIIIVLTGLFGLHRSVRLLTRSMNVPAACFPFSATVALRPAASGTSSLMCPSRNAWPSLSAHHGLCRAAVGGG